jgi:hypothetical protein
MSEIKKLLEELYFRIAVMYMCHLGKSDLEVKKMIYDAFATAEREMKEWFRVNCPECPELPLDSLDNYVDVDTVVFLAREYVRLMKTDSRR